MLKPLLRTGHLSMDVVAYRRRCWISPLLLGSQIFPYIAVMYAMFGVHYLHRWQVLILMGRVISHVVEDHNHKHDLRCFQLKQRGPLLFQEGRHCRLASKVMLHRNV